MKNEVIKNALLAAQRDGYNKIILYNEKEQDYVIIRDFEGNQKSFQSIGYNIIVGKVKTYYEHGILKAVFISSKSNRRKK